jgi:hypothetical protein
MEFWWVNSKSPCDTVRQGLEKLSELSIQYITGAPAIMDQISDPSLVVRFQLVSIFSSSIKRPLFSSSQLTRFPLVSLPRPLKFSVYKDARRSSSYRWRHRRKCSKSLFPFLPFSHSIHIIFRTNGRVSV